MRKRVVTALAVLSALISSWAVLPGHCFDLQTYNRFRQVATECEHQGKWLRIDWLKDMNQARARARAENKPILVFLVIGFHGEKNATDC